MKYIAYLSSGEILEANNFKIIYHATLSQIRNDKARAVIFHCKTNKQLIATIWRGFHKDLIFTNKAKIENIKALLRKTYMVNEWGKYCWDMVGLDN